ncbi:MAG: hypothetical protein ABEJ65_03020 [bacterium]
MITTKETTTYVSFILGMSLLLIVTGIPTAFAGGTKDTSTLKGTVYASTEDGRKPVSGALVFIEGIQPELEPKRNSLIDQVNQTFEPHVLPVRTGRKVEFKNSEMTLHNVRLVRPKNGEQLMNKVTYSNTKVSYTFEKAGVVEVRCDVHPSMLAYAIELDSPFLKVRTGEKGDFNLHISAKLEGEFTVRSWTENHGFSAPKQVNFDGDTQNVELVFSGDEKSK